MEDEKVLDIKERTNQIYDSMKLRQKATLLYGNEFTHTNAIPKCGIRSVSLFDGPQGPAKSVVDGTNAKASSFPSPCLLACSWDPELIQDVGKAIGKEAAHYKIDVLLAPGANIKRNPLCGRNFEYFSEDPLLSGKMAAGYINGVQSNGVGCCIKHFAANNQETNRMMYSSEIDPRALQEIYLKGFKIAIDESNPWAVMCSYNKLRGIYCSENEWLLNKTLREQWGYEGPVISDWGAVLHPVLCHNAGLDLEMPCKENRSKQIAKSVKKGLISQQMFEKSVKRMIELSLKTGNYSDEGFSYDHSYEMTLKAAEESMVLAKNTGILPLSSYDDCCIIGAYAKEPRFQGLGSAEVKPYTVTSLLDFAKTKKGKPIPFEKGYRMDDTEDKNLIFKAVDLASSKKKVILVLGLKDCYDKEGIDRPDMRLPESQVSLFKAIYSVNQNVIVVICTGAPVELPFVDDAKAVLLSYLGGAATGEAIHKILTGQVNPSGKTAETWPLHYYDVPNYANYTQDGLQVLYKESIYVGYRYYVTANKKTMFPFGHGLSYSRFEYSNLKINKDKIDDNKPAIVTLNVKNTSKIPGKEVVQLYISAKSASIFRVKRELKGFKKIFLDAGEQKTIEFEVGFDDFAHWSTTSEKFEVEGGEYLLEIGSSVEDIRLSEKIDVVSGYKENKYYHISFLPSYYNLEKDRDFNVMDYEFEMLLDHHIKYSKKKRFDWNSSLNSLSKKRVFKKVIKEIENRQEKRGFPPKIQKLIANETMSYPIRLYAPYFGERKLKVLLDRANRRPLLSIKDRLFYVRKK